MALVAITKQYLQRLYCKLTKSVLRSSDHCAIPGETLCHAPLLGENKRWEDLFSKLYDFGTKNRQNSGRFKVNIFFTIGKFFMLRLLIVVVCLPFENFLVCHWFCVK